VSTDAAAPTPTEGEQDARIAAALDRERPRLLRWLRRHVADPGEVEDILQDAFFELVLAYRMLRPIEHVGGWLFQVARNRVTDLFRKRKLEPLDERRTGEEEGAGLSLQDLLPSPEAGPHATYVRSLLADELEEALAALPAAQREVFLAHEVEGLSFEEISALSGVKTNTLLSRKHYAVLQLRRRLQDIFEQLRNE
jgi:RNA polymerase sigma factor (sigma-70 family)